MTPLVDPARRPSPPTFSPLLYVNECLLNRDRTLALREAIRRTVRPGDVVVDAGTGSGILALFAAEAGAARVYAVDVDPESLSLARRSVAASRFADRIELVEADAREFATPAPADVVVAEMLDTGLIAERQAPVLNALRRHRVIGPHTRVVPERVRCGLELVEYDFDFYGFAMPLVVQARNAGAQARVRRPLSEVAVYRDVALGEKILTAVDETVAVRVRRAGVLNAVRLTTQTVLCEGLAVRETSDMNMPVVLPAGPLEVRRGDAVEVSVRYVMGCGYGSLGLNVSPAGHEPNPGPSRAEAAMT
jgi:protein arginine N-methyltransferase 1